MYEQATRELMLLDLQSRQDAIYDKRVIDAMGKVPREEFVPQSFKDRAYEDMPIPIGFGQTISQPYTVAKMTEILQVGRGDKVLEIGTGSGYQAAVLSLLARKVYTLEIIPDLARQARKRLKRLGFGNTEVKEATGSLGWREKSPFDRILVTAGMETVPKELFNQLKDGGVLVAPVGIGIDKIMTKFKKANGKISKEEFGIFHFVPFVGNKH